MHCHEMPTYRIASCFRLHRYVPHYRKEQNPHDFSIGNRR